MKSTWHSYIVEAKWSQGKRPLRFSWITFVTNMGFLDVQYISLIHHMIPYLGLPAWDSMKEERRRLPFGTTDTTKFLVTLGRSSIPFFMNLCITMTIIISDCLILSIARALNQGYETWEASCNHRMAVIRIYPTKVSFIIHIFANENN